jgi:hypothetical protein
MAQTTQEKKAKQIIKIINNYLKKIDKIEKQKNNLLKKYNY